MARATLAPPRPRRARRCAALALLAALPACAHPPALPASPPLARPALLAPTSGRYLLRQGGEAIGVLDFTVTSSAGRWRARGVREDRAGVRLESALEVDVARLEPLAFSFAVDVLGERREARATLEADDHFHVRGAGLGRPFERRVPHGTGTLVDLFADPVTKLLALPLLLPALARGAPVPVRTVLFVAPALEPVVMLATYTPRGERCGLRLVELEAGGARVALWLRADGLPVRVRAFGDGPPLEHVLEGEVAALSACQNGE